MIMRDHAYFLIKYLFEINICKKRKMLFVSAPPLPLKPCFKLVSLGAFFDVDKACSVNVPLCLYFKTFVLPENILVTLPGGTICVGGAK